VHSTSGEARIRSSTFWCCWPLQLILLVCSKLSTMSISTAAECWVHMRMGNGWVGFEFNHCGAELAGTATGSGNGESNICLRQAVQPDSVQELDSLL